MGERFYRPGEDVPASGIYLVRHAPHREAHEVLAVEGDRFPRCRVCGSEVHFELLRLAAPIDGDADFAGHES